MFVGCVLGHQERCPSASVRRPAAAAVVSRGDDFRMASPERVSSADDHTWSEADGLGLWKLLGIIPAQRERRDQGRLSETWISGWLTNSCLVIFVTRIFFRCLSACFWNNFGICLVLSLALCASAGPCPLLIKTSPPMT